MIFLSEMTLLRWLNFLPAFLNDSHSLALLDLFLFSDTSISFTMAFPPFGKSDHLVVSVSINFLSNLKWDVPFHVELMAILLPIGMVFVII